MLSSLHDLRAVFDGLPAWSGVVPQNFIANFLGVMTDVGFYRNEQGEFAKPSHAKSFEAALAGARDMTVQPPGIEAGEAFMEMAAVLRSVRAAKGRYVMVELGGGYGARAVDAAVALRTINPMPCTTVVVEPIPTHVARAKQHFLNNGLTPDDHWFLTMAVSADNVPQLIPLGVGRYGNTINADNVIAEIFKLAENAANAQVIIRSFLTHKKLVVSYNNTPQPIAGFISCMTLEEILFPFPMVDLVDMDIQLIEGAVVPQNIDLLGRKVKTLNIGTHSAEIHTNLLALFRSRGWTILAEFAPNSNFSTEFGDFRTGDGVLMVENPRAADMSHAV